MRSSALLLALAIPPLVATTASAGPIRLTYLQYGSEPAWSILLPDDFTTAGFEFTLDSRRIPHTYPRPTPGTWPTPSTERTEYVSGQLIFDREPLRSSVYSPDSLAFDFRGSLTGIIRDSGVGGVWGTLEGVINPGISLRNRNDTTGGGEFGPDRYERWVRDMGISRAFLDYLVTPGTLKLSATVTDGYQNRLPIVLTVAPMPVPEPASWAAWALAASGAWAWRRRRAARSR